MNNPRFLRLTYASGYVKIVKLDDTTFTDFFSQIKYNGLVKVEVADPTELIPEQVELKGKGAPDNWSPTEISREQFIVLVKSFGTNAKIPAIKFVRAILPGALGLLEAKNLVEAIFEMP